MENKKLTNDQNIKNLKKRETLRYVLIVLDFITILLALADLFIQRTILLVGTIILFLIALLLNKYRESIPINKSEKIEDKKEVKEEKNTKKKTSSKKSNNKKKNK